MGCSLVMILTGLAFLLACFTRCHAQDCNTLGWFGDNCHYKCHCVGNLCQPSGECEQGVMCEKGWFGPACQYVDLSYTNATSLTPDYLQDGDDTTCNSDSNAQSVTIPLTGYFPFTWFRIHVKYADSVCSSGKYGRECENTCNCAGGSECLMTGGCPAGCAAGYHGETCNEPCPEGRYGVDCREMCSTNCVDQKCNFVSGDCDQCPAGKKGKQCEEDCDPKTWGENCVHACSTNCLEQLCNAITGVCLKCPPGNLGPQCDKDCPPQFYGDNCSLPCSNACVNQECNGTNGVCNTCPTGKTGKECEEDCPFLTFGDGCRQSCSQTCGEGGSCHPVNGECSNGCVPGYTGAMCQNKCDKGTYGKDCGEQCSEYCNSNRTGPNESPCDHIDGKCVDGCQTGYQEPTCENLASSGGQPTTDDGLITGLGVGLTLAILVAVGIGLSIYCYRRRQETTRSRRRTPPGYDDVNPPRQDEHNYDAIYKSSDNYDLPHGEISGPATLNQQEDVNYVNADVGHYEMIFEEGLRGDPDGHTGEEKDSAGYVNCRQN